MPWKECCKVDERLRFVARLLAGEEMAALCRELSSHDELVDVAVVLILRVHELL